MDKRPNIVVFYTDQQRWDTTGVHGNPLGLTPNFDRMAAEGTFFYHSFTCQPVCAPARACLQTGTYATFNGVFRNGLSLQPGLPTLAGLLGQAGYQTAYIGKWHLGSEDEMGPVAKHLRGGYEYWLAANVLEFTSTAYDTVLYDGDGKAVLLPGYRVDALTDAAIRYIDRHQKEPFFLLLSFLEPHHQNQIDDYVAPVGYRERYTGAWIPPDLAALGGSTHQHIAGYYGQVKRLDEALGRLREALISLDLLTNTILVFTSDHGNHFKTRNSEYKRSCHESCVRVPLAITGPGFDGGGRVLNLVHTVDLPPTLLEAAGLTAPETMQGRSMLPLVRQRSVDWPNEVFIQISESQVGRAIRTRRWKYGVVAPDLDGWNQPGAEMYREEYLYDLEADPYELNNLIGLASHRPLTDRLRQRLIQRMQAAGEPIPLIEPAPLRPSGQRVVTEKELQEVE